MAGLFDGTFGMPAGLLGLGGMPLDQQNFQQMSPGGLPAWLQTALLNIQQGGRAPDEMSAQRAPAGPMQAPPMQQPMGTPQLDGDNNPIPGLGMGAPQFGGAMAQAQSGPMAGAQPGMPPQAPPQMVQPSQGPGLLQRLAGTGGAIGGAANFLGAITGQRGGVNPETSTGPAGQVYRLMISKGVNPTAAKLMASQQETAMAWIATQAKPQARPMTPEEKTRYGLSASAPYVMGEDGVPKLPEGSRPEIKGDANSGYQGIDPYSLTSRPVTGGPAPQPKFDDVTKLRTEIQALPSYKNHAQAAPIYKTMLETAGRDTRASDLNLVYGLGKIFDPGSVVREGEMIMVKNTAGLPDWLVGQINSLNGGAGLTPATRKAILTEAYSRMKSYEDVFDRDTQQYKGIGTRNRMNLDDIIPPLERAKPWEPQAAAPGSGGTPAPAAAPPPNSGTTKSGVPWKVVR